MRTWLRRTLRTLVILAGIVVLLLLASVSFVLLAWDRPVDRPAGDLHAPGDPQTLARGEYLYQTGMRCWSCHGSNGSRDRNEPQAGGRLFDMSSIGPGFGRVWASNLTSDEETGLGRATDGQIVRAIREGIDQRGRVIFPVMAYQFYHDLGDTDVLAIVAYVRTLAPVRRDVPARELSFIAKALIAFGMIAPEAPITAAVVAPLPGSTVEYGRYVAWQTSGCAECHTPRFPGNGQLDRTRLMGGGLFAFPETGFSTTGSNLTPDELTGLGRWTEAEFVTAVRTGMRPSGQVMVPFMPWPTYYAWPDEDLHAVWLYLRSLAPVSHAVPATTLTGDAAGESGVARGAGLFDVYCVDCHGVEGRGGSLTTIALADFARGADADSLSSFVAEGPPAGIAMPAFGRTLTDDQIRDIVLYLKGLPER